MSKLLWSPSQDRVERSNLWDFQAFVNRRHSLCLAGYEQLYDWSVQDPANFWDAVWDHCRVRGVKGSVVVEDLDQFPGARWFPDARLNFAENLLSFRGSELALIRCSEDGRSETLSYDELYLQVAQLGSALRDLGVQQGDRVAAYLPNCAEAVIAMLATASIGALWSSCSPEFGVGAALDRFGQIQPKVLFAIDGYYYGGRAHDVRERVMDVADALDSLDLVVMVRDRNLNPDMHEPDNVIWFDEFLDPNASLIDFAQMPFAHPLYIMFSSGTTGKPKCIVHSAGGTLLQHLKEHQLMVDLCAGDRLFYFTTTGWMMWNWLVSGLASGATLVLYDGAPFAQNGQALIDLIDDCRIDIFGVGASYLAALEKRDIRPQETHHLESLRTLLSTGSPLSPKSFAYVYREFKADLCLGSISGGTDIISCFVGCCPFRPVYEGQIQARWLGMAVEFWDEQGQALPAGKGELVCVKPFPSAPLGLWEDPGNERYLSSYFSRWPGVWAHGDYGEHTPEDGVIIHGRSDATLNPSGVRLGTAEIYRQVERIDEVTESVAIGWEQGFDTQIVLFIVLAPGAELTESLRQRISAVIRVNASPWHVPAAIFEVADIPRTFNGKIAELAVRAVIHDEEVKNLSALANPESLEHFRNLSLDSPS